MVAGSAAATRNVSRRCAKRAPFSVGREARLVPVDAQLAREQHAAEGAVERQPGRAGGQRRAVDVEHDGAAVEPFDDGDEVDRAGHHPRELADRGEEHAHISTVGAGRARCSGYSSGWSRLRARHAACMNDTQQQRSALVFGARNLGRAVIERLRADGWAVAAVARSESTPGDRRGGGRAGHGAATSPIPRASASALARTAEAHGGVDLVLNAASAYGGDRSGPFGGGPLADAAARCVRCLGGRARRAPPSPSCRRASRFALDQAPARPR